MGGLVARPINLRLHAEGYKTVEEGYTLYTCFASSSRPGQPFITMSHCTSVVYNKNLRTRF